jgi:hypothetical protein
MHKKRKTSCETGPPLSKGILMCKKINYMMSINPIVWIQYMITVGTIYCHGGKGFPPCGSSKILKVSITVNTNAHCAYQHDSHLNSTQQPTTYQGMVVHHISNPKTQYTAQLPFAHTEKVLDIQTRNVAYSTLTSFRAGLIQCMTFFKIQVYFLQRTERICIQVD